MPKSSTIPVDQVLVGVLLRLLAAFLFTAMSAVVRAASETLPTGQIMFWRSALAILPVILYLTMLRQFPNALRTEHPLLHLTRGLLGGLAMGLSFLSLAYLPVAIAQSLGFLAPVLTIPLAAILLREKLSKRVIIAVLLGFLGAILLLLEALELPGEGGAIGIAAGLGFALTLAVLPVMTKSMTNTESAASIAFYFAVVSALMGLATMSLGWEELTRPDFGWLCLAGLLGGAAQIAAAEALARAPVSRLAPLDFTGLVWAIGFDVLLFKIVPGAWGLIGIFAITLAALLASYSKAAPKTLSPPS